MQNHRAPHQKNFTRYVLTGLATILPLWITLNVLWLLFKLISGVFSPIIAPIYHTFFATEESELLSRLTSFFLTIGVVWGVGAVATNLAGRRLLIKIENIFIRLPILREIYVAVRKLTVYVFSKKAAFRRVVMIEYPRRGIYSLGFITSDTMGEVQEKTKEEVVNVFVPSTPNPTTGFLLLVPRKDVISLQMSVDDAVKLIITGGIVTPSTPQRSETEELKGDPDISRETVPVGGAHSARENQGGAT